MEKGLTKLRRVLKAGRDLALYVGDLGVRRDDAHESKYYLESCCWERYGGLHETRNRMET